MAWANEQHPLSGCSPLSIYFLFFVLSSINNHRIHTYSSFSSFVVFPRVLVVVFGRGHKVVFPSMTHANATQPMSSNQVGSVFASLRIFRRVQQRGQMSSIGPNADAILSRKMQATAPKCSAELMVLAPLGIAML
jgi:hypothetical protein